MLIVTKQATIGKDTTKYDTYAKQPNTGFGHTNVKVQTIVFEKAQSVSHIGHITGKLDEMRCPLSNSSEVLARINSLSSLKEIKRTRVTTQTIVFGWTDGRTNTIAWV